MRTALASRPLSLALAATLAGATPLAFGAEDTSVVTVGLGAEYSDNIRREAANEESDTVATASISPRVAHWAWPIMKLLAGQ